MIIKLSQQMRPKKPEGAIQLGLTNPIWETVETCWKTRPSDRLTVTQVLESWEREINGTGLPAAEQGERRRSRTTSVLGTGDTSTLSLRLYLPQTDPSDSRWELSLVEIRLWRVSESVCRVTVRGSLFS